MYWEKRKWNLISYHTILKAPPFVCVCVCMGIGFNQTVCCRDSMRLFLVSSSHFHLIKFYIWLDGILYTYHFNKATCWNMYTLVTHTKLKYAFILIIAVCRCLNFQSLISCQLIHQFIFCFKFVWHYYN